MKIIAYHWSPEYFKKFDSAYIGSYNSSTFLEGFYFANKLKADEGYIYKCELTITNPIEIDMNTTSWDSIGVQEAIRAFLKGSEWGYLKEYLTDNLELSEEDAINTLNRWKNADGVILSNIQYDWHNLEYIVFNEDQIKILSIEEVSTENIFEDSNINSSFNKYGKWSNSENIFEHVNKQINEIIGYNGGATKEKSDGLKYYALDKKYVKLLHPRAKISQFELEPKNTFDYDNHEHVKMLLNSLPETIMIKDNYRNVSIEYTKEEFENILKGDPNTFGNWMLLEDENIQKIIKDLGFDSMYLLEYSFSGKQWKNIAMFEDLNDAFYKWFGKSKIVNPDGTPKIVYHRSSTKFDTFKKEFIKKDNLSGEGFYFSGSDDKNKKQSYGKEIGKFYLRMENPLYKTSKVKRETLKPYLSDEILNYIFRDRDEIMWGIFIFSAFTWMSENKKFGEIDTTSIIKNLGYDGIIDDMISDDYIVFEPNQIKSVDNKGEWSNSENIYEEFNEAVAEITKETLPELNDNFWGWFGNSVVKDDEGNPLICFHGSTLDINEFDTEYSGKNTGNNEEKVFYFTTDREMAISYSTEAIIRQKELPYYDKEEGTEYETWEEFEEYLRKEVCKTPHINPCFICMEKPYIYDAGFRDFDPKLNYTLMSMIKGEIDTSHWLFDEELYCDIANEHEEYDEETDEYIQIKDFDYDGIIIKNVRDSISPLVDKYCDEYIVWSPTQIKSIYNKGNWSWNSRNVFETLNKEMERYL